MDIYKHIKYNPHMRSIEDVIVEAQKESKEWCFVRSQPVTEYEWVAIFEKWEYEITGEEIKKVGTLSANLSPMALLRLAERHRWEGDY